MGQISPPKTVNAAAPPRAANPYRVMIVEDSAIIRGLLTRWLQEDEAVVVTGSYSTGAQAVRNIRQADPDVVVLDIEMPEMDGIEALPHLLRAVPDVKILMASTLTRRNAEITLRALSLGAADTLAKPEATRDPEMVAAFRRELAEKVRILAAIRRKRRGEPAPEPTPGPAAEAAPAAPGPRPAGSGPLLRAASQAAPAVLGIGSSTGGPQALARLLAALPARIDLPILIAQHMPRTFTAILAEHLGRASGRPCAEATDGVPVRPGHIYVAPGDFHMVAARQRGQTVLRLDQGPPENFCRPSVDPLFRSLAALYGPAALALVLTGMGHDGREGARALVESGGTLLAQDEPTSVVWGMPGAVAQAGLCSGILPLDALAPAIDRLMRGGAA